MADLLHLSVKRRRRNGGFLDVLAKEYNQYKNGSQEPGGELKGLIENWLVEEELLSDPREETDSVNLLNLADIIMNRVCEISGHVWLEFIEGLDDSPIRGAAEQRREMINAYVAEFIPTFELLVDLIFEVFESAEGGEILWSYVTNEHLLRLFGHLLDESQPNKKSPASNRPPAGALTGDINLISPAQLRQHSQFWFKDRDESYMTPAWQADDPLVVITSYVKQNSGVRYSFTPEYYSDAENCVTWASQVLDSLVAGDWLSIVRAQCSIDPATLHDGGCNDSHIKEQGRMGCATRHASQADKRRQDGLAVFD